MPRFFVAHPVINTVCLTGDTAQHIRGSLRMQPGEKIILCDGAGWDYHCRLTAVTPTVQAVLEKRVPNETEPNVSITLYQALAKKDKFEQIVQKAVELGAVRIVPVLTRRCVSRPEPKAMDCLLYTSRCV